VLTFSTQIPRQDESSGLLLRFAYVVDQDGMVLGVESNASYRALKDQAEGRKVDESGSSSGATTHDNADRKEEEAEEEQDSGPHMNLDFYIVPSVTQKIQSRPCMPRTPPRPA
jgi:hypothetical protein